MNLTALAATIAVIVPVFAAAEDRLIVFSAPAWCGPCRDLERDVIGSKEWNALECEASVVDFDEDRALAKRRGVKSVPTAILLDSEGNEIARKVGYRGEPAKVWLAPFIREKRR